MGALPSPSPPGFSSCLASFGVALDKAIETGTQAVFTRFDGIEKFLLGEDARSVRAGKPSIPQMIETIA